MDFRAYIQIPGEWDWIQQEQTRLGGEPQFYAMRAAMHLLLSEIQEGQYFDIEKRVKPENHHLFVKITCEWMTLPLGRNYTFNRLMNRVYHEREIKLPLTPTTPNEQK